MSEAQSTNASIPAGAAKSGSNTVLWLTLCVFVLTLPLTEAPKNIAAGLYVALWAWRAASTRDAGGPWDRFDTVFALMFGSAALSAVIGGDASDLSGVFRVISVAWVAKRVALSQRQVIGLFSVACLGLAASILIGAVPFVQGENKFFELPSLGQVNQSALYVAVLACAALGWTLQGPRPERAWFPAVAASAVLFGLTLLVGGSRAAILAYAIFIAIAIPAVLWSSWRNSRTRRLVLVAGFCLIAGAAVVMALGNAYPQLSGRKLQPTQWVNAHSMDQRFGHWRLAVDAWKQKPWLGFGPDAFNGLTAQQVCTWRAQRGESCDPSRYLAASHAHSLYFATLVERGLAGLAVLACLLGLWLWELVRTARQASWSRLWVGSAAGFVVVAAGGLFNTTLRVEHGSLALLMLGLWLASGENRGDRAVGGPEHPVDA